MRIALLGYGTVGRAVRGIVEARCAGTIEVAAILRRPGKCDEPCMTDSFEDIASDPSIDAVVEVMGGIEPARTYILASLKAGKHVITANKAVVAEHIDQFAAAAEAGGAHLYVEACVGGGIPWIANLVRAARIDAVESFSGILNGTSNYILDRMYREGADFAEVLADAQALGYAEADPSADIDGIDVRNKAVISACVAFGCRCRADVPTLGIRRLGLSVMRSAEKLGFAVKLMAHGRAEGGRYAVAVMPTLVPAGSIEAAVSANFNVASLVGATIGELKFYGQGAGGDPTGNAVVQDLIDCHEGLGRSYALGRKLAWDPSLLASGAVAFLDGPAAEGALPESAEQLAPGVWSVPSATPEEVVALDRALVALDPAAFVAYVAPGARLEEVSHG